MSAMKEDTKDKLDNMDKFYQEQFESMNHDIEAVRLMAREAVSAKEKELTDLMNKQVRTIQLFVDENISDMVQERKATLAKYEK